MRKLVAGVSCVLILCMFVVTAWAAHMGLSATASTLHRGDTFSIYVNLSNDQEVGRGGIVLSYDAGVFEFLGGSCNVGGATLAEVSAGRNGGVFALAENRVVSGTIFTIQMRVRSDAPFGTFTISGAASMDVPCSAGSTSVTVVCKHSYGSFTGVDGSTHKRVCSICKEEDTASHNWDSGTVKQAATCKATGVKTFQCRGCDQTREETIPVSSVHSYGNWEQLNEKSHRGTCTVCGRADTLNHVWNRGTVTKEATCTETGIRELQCVCGAEKTEEISVAVHRYDAFRADDGNTHTHTCRDCGKTETLSHSYSGNHTHDIHAHYAVCDDCGYVAAAETHVPGEAATMDTPQRCTVCSRVLKPALSHVHSYADQWSADAQSHWYACAECDEQSGLRIHDYDGPCDADCNTCGYEREAPHAFRTELTGAWNGHWYPCEYCYQRSNFSAHTPGPEASIRAAQTCTGCGWELAPRIDHPHVYDTVVIRHYHECVCGEQTEAADGAHCSYCEPVEAAVTVEEPVQTPFPWWIVCILEAAAIAGLVVVLLVYKKQNVSEESGC